jgi:hypothetical protein
MQQAKNTHEPLFCLIGMECNPLSVALTWHRPYVEALLEEDWLNVPTLIASAERAILVRYIEIPANPGYTDESLHLQHAMHALSQLKEADGIVTSSKSTSPSQLVPSQ